MIYATSKGKTATRLWVRVSFGPSVLQSQCPAGEGTAGQTRLGQRDGEAHQQELWGFSTLFCFFFSIPMEICASADENLVWFTCSNFWYHSLNSAFYFKTCSLFWRVRKPKMFLCIFFALGCCRPPVFRNTHLNLPPSSLRTARTALRMEPREPGNDWGSSIQGLNTSVFLSDFGLAWLRTLQRTLNQGHPFAPTHSPQITPTHTAPGPALGPSLSNWWWEITESPAAAPAPSTQIPELQTGLCGFSHCFQFVFLSSRSRKLQCWICKHRWQIQSTGPVHCFSPSTCYMF